MKKQQVIELTNDTTEVNHATTDGSLQTDGLSVVKDIIAGNDLKLLLFHVLSLGAGSDATLTHWNNWINCPWPSPHYQSDSTGSLDLSSVMAIFKMEEPSIIFLDLDGTPGAVIMQLKVDSDDFVFKQWMALKFLE